MADPVGTRSTRVGIDVSGSMLRSVCLDGKDAIVSTFSASVEPSEPRGPQIVNFITSLKAKFGDFGRVGISFPGLVDRKAQRVAISAQIPEHADADVVNDIHTATGLQITIENDANAAAFGEFKLGAGRGSRNIFYITLGEGVGGAFIFDGEIWRGAAGFAGEFGYVAINSEGKRLEGVASRENIVRRTRNRLHQDNTSSLNNIGEEAITLSAIIAAAEEDDDFAQMMLERTGAYVGSAVASVINLMNIEKIVVGGEIMQAKELVLDAIIDRARKFSFRPSFNSTSIVEGDLGENAAAVGAALLADEPG
jgi:glucokinase